MGQFLDYLANVFAANPDKSSLEAKSKSNNHVTFADMSPFNFSKSADKSEAPVSKPAILSRANKKIIYIYALMGLFVSGFHFALVSAPQLKLEASKLFEAHAWEHVTLCLVPWVTYVIALSAMNEINRPVASCARLTAKNAGLDFKNNQFVHSLKLVCLLMVASQVLSIYSNDIRYLWSAIVTVSGWCYYLTLTFAQEEQKRYTPTAKKQWAGLNIVRSPKSQTSSNPESPVKSTSSPTVSPQTKATPRTRTRRAVKNLITGVSDKYHAFEQNVAHQISTKIFTPLSPKNKMIE